MYVMRPQGVSRSMFHWSLGTQSSGVRFWNFTASQPARHGAVDDLAREIERPVVVDADLGDDEHRLVVADEAIGDANGGVAHSFTPFVERCVGRPRARGHHAVHPPSTTRLKPVK